MFIESVMPSSHLILCCPLLLLPSILPTIRVFSRSQFFTSGGQSTRISASAISPSSEYSGLISFRMDKFNLLAVQGTLKSILQYQFKSINSFVLSFFIVQLSHPYMTTGETIVLIKWTFVGKLMSLLFFQGARVFSFHGCSHLCSDFGAPKICHCFHCFPVYVPRSNGPRCLDLSFLNVEFKPTFSLSSFTFIKRLCSSSLSAIGVMSFA